MRHALSENRWGSVWDGFTLVKFSGEEILSQTIEYIDLVIAYFLDLSMGTDLKSPDNQNFPDTESVRKD